MKVASTAARGGGPGGLDHRRLRVDADHFAAIRRKADREQAGPCADVEQALPAVEPEFARNRGEERRAVRRPGDFVIGDGGGEASHGVLRLQKARDHGLKMAVARGSFWLASPAFTPIMTNFSKII